MTKWGGGHSHDEMGRGVIVMTKWGGGHSRDEMGRGS